VIRWVEPLRSDGLTVTPHEGSTLHSAAADAQKNLNREIRTKRYNTGRGHRGLRGFITMWVIREDL